VAPRPLFGQIFVEKKTQQIGPDLLLSAHKPSPNRLNVPEFSRGWTPSRESARANFAGCRFEQTWIVV